MLQGALGAKNGIGAKEYVFEQASLMSKSGKYSAQMIRSCNVLGMKPVCEHPSYCRNDKNSLYLGQQHHISYPPHRKNTNYMPAGFQQIQDRFNGLCVYANNAAGARGLCNIPINTHSWRYPKQADPGFICGKQQSVMFSGFLGARNGVSARKYNFQVTRLTDKSGKFADGMIAKCAELGMKPVCDHRNYCSADPKALYIGQDHHIG